MIKKVVTLLITTILIFTLSSCGNNKQKYTPVPEFDIKTCGDDCLYEAGTKSDRWLDEVYRNKSDYKYEVPSDFNFVFFIGSGNLIDRTDLNTGFPIDGKFREDYLDAFNGFSIIVSQFLTTVMENELEVDECLSENTCTSIFMPGSVIKNIKYGFTSESGYVEYDVYRDDKLETSVKFAYAVVDEELEYESYQMQYATESLLYVRLKDGVFAGYRTLSNQNFVYYYIDLNTKEYITQIFFEDDKTSFYYFDPIDNIGYQYFWKGEEYAMFKTNDDVDVFRLVQHEEEYYVEINFLQMNGYDQIKDYTSPLNFNLDPLDYTKLELYNDGSIVYEDYDVYSHFNTGYYNGIYGRKYLTFDEITKFELPDELIGDIDATDIRQKFLDFASLENPTDVLPYTVDELKENYESLKDYLK